MNAAVCWMCVDQWLKDNPDKSYEETLMRERIRQGRCAWNEHKGKPTMDQNGDRVFEPKKWCLYSLEQTVV